VAGAGPRRHRGLGHRSMGILDRYQAQTGGSWKAAQAAELEFDFDTHALAGVKLGDPVSLLWKFGPPEDDEQARQETFRYYSLGFAVDGRHGRVDGFLLMWNDRDQGRFKPFAGRCRRRGAEVPLRAGLAEKEFLHWFGEPFWRDEDERETLLFYELGAVEWQFEFDHQTGLAAASILALPLLADPAQRQASDASPPAKKIKINEFFS